MTEFIANIVQYIVIALFLAAVGGVGALFGIKMRKAADAKTEMMAEEE